MKPHFIFLSIALTVISFVDSILSVPMWSAMWRAPQEWLGGIIGNSHYGSTYEAQTTIRRLPFHSISFEYTLPIIQAQMDHTFKIKKHLQVITSANLMYDIQFPLWVLTSHLNGNGTSVKSGFDFILRSHHQPEERIVIHVELQKNNSLHFKFDKYDCITIEQHPFPDISYSIRCVSRPRVFELKPAKLYAAKTSTRMTWTESSSLQYVNIEVNKDRQSNTPHNQNAFMVEVNASGQWPGFSRKDTKLFIVLNLISYLNKWTSPEVTYIDKP